MEFGFVGLVGSNDTVQVYCEGEALSGAINALLDIFAKYDIKNRKRGQPLEVNISDVIYIVVLKEMDS